MLRSSFSCFELEARLLVYEKYDNVEDFLEITFFSMYLYVYIYDCISDYFTQLYQINNLRLCFARHFN